MTADNDDNHPKKPGEPSGPSLDFGNGPSEPPASNHQEGGTQQLELGEQPNYEPTAAGSSSVGEKMSQFIEKARDGTRELVNKFAKKKRPPQPAEPVAPHPFDAAPPPAELSAPSAPSPDSVESFEKTGQTQFLPTQDMTFSQNVQKFTEGLTGKVRNFAHKMKSAPNAFDPATMAGWVGSLSSSLQKRGISFYLKAGTVVICAYVYADLSALFLSRFIPEPPPSRGMRYGSLAKHVPVAEDYAPIFARNLFSSKGLVPGEDQPGNSDPGGPPVKTTLPFTLVGTIILQDELRSIGTIEDKSASMVYPVRVDDEIPSKAKILKVEARKVIFLNTQANRREYVELPDDISAVNPRITLGSPAGGGGAGIEQMSPNQFFVNRGEVDKALSDLNNILTQARAVPNFENGLPSGYKLFQIVPGSIYDKLGLRNGDVIAGMDGAPVNDPGKAFEALGKLKDTSHLELTIKRDGKAQNFSYDIR